MKGIEHSQLKIKTQVKVGSLKLQYDVPKRWSINKFKCLLTSEIPSLNFDQFQICFKGKLQRGNYKMGEIEENKTHQKIELEIIKTKSQIKLADYYKASMQNFMSLTRYQKQPVLCTDYQNYKNMTKQKKNQNDNNQNNVNDFNINQINDDFDQGNNPNNPAHPLLRLLRLLGTYFIIVLIYDHGKAYQIAIILTIILAYFGIDIFIRYKQKKIKKEQNRQTNRYRNVEGQNEPNQILNQYIQNNVRKGFIKLYFYKIVEFLYCFFFTFFPNLTIDVHLEINQLRIQQARKEINLILPNTYPNAQNPRANMNN